jgi:hypothetical protein
MESNSRPWREIARELASETDNNRAWELSQELDKALEEQETLKKPFLMEKPSA